jgi:hypothetical protein
MVLANIIYFLLKIILFIGIIYSMHHGWEIIKKTYSVPKKRNIFNSEIEKYKQIIQTIQEGSPRENIENNEIFDNEEAVTNMNNELAQFMNDEINKIQ